MIQIKDKESGESLGEITEEQLNFLVEQLEEEDLKDTDYYICKDTLEMLKKRNADAGLIELLTNALGTRDGMEIQWIKK